MVDAQIQSFRAYGLLWVPGNKGRMGQGRRTLIAVFASSRSPAPFALNRDNATTRNRLEIAILHCKSPDEGWHVERRHSYCILDLVNAMYHMNGSYLSSKYFYCPTVYRACVLQK